MKRIVSMVFGAAFAGAAHAVTFTNISFAFGGGFSGATQSIPSPYTGSSYSATLTNATLSGSTPGTTTWEFDFIGQNKNQNVSGFMVTIDGTLTANNQNAQGKITLTSLDVLDTGVSGSPNVFDLSKNGGGAESDTIGSGNFAISFPLKGGDFSLSNKYGAVNQGQFSLGNTYQVAGGGKLTITEITVTPQPTPEPAGLLLLGLPAVGVFVKKRRSK